MISIEVRFPQEMVRNANLRQQIHNAAYFIRDLWVSMSPTKSGDYVRGLQKQNSVTIRNGIIRITNYSQHCRFYEEGHAAFNLGMAMLNKGKNVKVAKDGTRYKVIKIPIGMKTKMRNPSVAESIQKHYKNVAPIGMSFKSYGDSKKMKPTRFRAISGGKSKNSNIFVVSEKAIRQNPRKWYVPAMKGRKLSIEVKKKAFPIIQQAIMDAMKAENDRKQRMSGRRRG